jgi:hypothetical protein
MPGYCSPSLVSMTQATAATRPAELDRGLLTPDQVAQFDRDGYLVLKRRIDPDLLARLRSASQRWMADGLARGPQAGSDWLFAHRPHGPVMWRVDYIHGKGEPASLELLGSRAVLGIAESLAGPDFVPTYESMVMKSAGDGAPVPWHQDAVHARRHRLFNVDVYLDDSRRGAGALHVIPGSQVQRTDACALAETYGWELPGAIEVELEAGDVLVHDDMIVHGSPPASGNALRRTIYFEFRAARSILDDGPWTPEWMDARLRLIPLALAEREKWVGADEQFEWRVSPALRPVVSDDVEAELRVVHTAHTPGEWCSAG